MCEPEVMVDFGLLAKSKISSGTAITVKQILVKSAGVVRTSDVKCC